LDIFYSPIWDALEALKSGCNNTFSLLEKQDVNVLGLLFEPERGYNRELTLKPFTKKRVLDLRRLATESALATIILLRLEKRNSSSLANIPKEFLDEVIFYFLINIFVCEVLPYKYCGQHIIEVLCSNFGWRESSSIKSICTTKSVDSTIEQRINYKRLLAMLKRSRSLHEYMFLFNRLDEGTTQLIEQELGEIYSLFNQQSRFELIDTRLSGVFWAMTGVNRICPEIDKSVLFKKEGKYFVEKYHSIFLGKKD
jgi:hypothetical protein